MRLRLGVNVDHVATVRKARGGARPDPLRAARLAMEAGADGITMHLREDRRHVVDADIERFVAEGIGRLNFEMAATAEMLALALRLKPAAACLVPERREERTTEGGLDLSAGAGRLREAVAALTGAGVRASLFIEPTPGAVDAALALGAPVVELHTGAWCEALAAGDAPRARAESHRLAAAAAHGAAAGIELHAGHGLDYDAARDLARVPGFAEFNIGHFLVGEAIMVGLPEAVRAMRLAMDEGRGEPEPSAALDPRS